MNPLDNLKPFKKGVSGNPNGRPKGVVSMTQRLKRLLNKKITNHSPIEKTNKSDKIANHLIEILVAKALSGEDKAMVEIMNRIDGKPKEHVEISGIDGNAIKTENYENMSEEEAKEKFRIARDEMNKSNDKK